MRFKRVYVEITNVCNLKCSFCPTSTRSNKFLTKEEFSHILNKIKDFTEYIYLHVKGEPLLHPDLNAFLNECEEKNLKVNLTTNGTLIESYSDMLMSKKAIRQISFSLQSIENLQTYESKELYLKNIIKFSLQAMDETNMYIELRLWNLASDTNSQNSDILKMIEKELKLDRPIIEQVDTDKGTRLKERIYLSQNKVFDWPGINKETIDHVGYCYGLKQQIAILVDGTVVPCCLDSEGDINLGNIFIEPISTILEKQRTKHMLIGFSQKRIVEPLCQKCGYRKRFS